MLVECQSAVGEEGTKAAFLLVQQAERERSRFSGRGLVLDRTRLPADGGSTRGSRDAVTLRRYIAVATPIPIITVEKDTT